MKTFQNIFFKTVYYFFILLFIYASVSKLLDFENFQVQIAQSPLLSAYAGFISYAVIIVEIIIVLCLTFQKSRLIALYASTALMSAFTIYIYLILNHSDFVPCSCGGILEKLGWTEHLIFNIICVILGIITILWLKSTDKIKLRQTILILCGSNILSIAVVVILFVSSEHIIKKENNFIRRFIPNFLSEPTEILLNNNGYYFAGIKNDKIILGNRITPLIMTSVNSKNSSLSHFRIYPDLGNYQFKNLRTAFKDSYYYLYDGTVPIIYRGKDGKKRPEILSYNDAFFSQLAVIDSASFALRTQSSTTHSFTLAKLDVSQSQKLKLYPKILNEENNDIFELDGELIGNQVKPATIVYTYSYINKFVVIDSNFMNVNEQKTIDQHEKANVQVTKLSNGDHKMSAPPLQVNSSTSSVKNFVFITSEVRGRFEPQNIHKNRKTIDVYNTLLKKYVGSFYLPEKKINDLLVTEKGLMIITEKSLIQYRFRKQFN